MPNQLNISNLVVNYSTGEREIRALDDLSLEIPTEGYTMGVVGESGSGKTTLGLSILLGIQPPGKIVSGSIAYNGKDVLGLTKAELQHYRWEQASMVFQSAMNSLNPVRPIIDPIVEVLTQHRGTGKTEATESALELLSSVGIPQDRAFDYPHEFSGGMRQRVVIALALALSPKLLVVDEPTSALDVVVQRQILALLNKEASQKGLTLLFITHEIALLHGLVHNVIVMYAGEIVERGPLEKVLQEPLHPYTEMLLGTILRFDSSLDLINREKLKESRGLPPWGSCKFSNRCKYVFDRCRKERPKLREVEKGRWVACHKFE